MFTEKWKWIKDQIYPTTLEKVLNLLYASLISAALSFLEASLGLWICPKHNKVIPIGTCGQQVGDIFSTVTQLVGAIAGPGPPERLNRLLHAISSLLFLIVYLGHPFNGQCKYLWTAWIFSSHETLFIGWTDIVEMLLYTLLFGLDFMGFITLVPSRKQNDIFWNVLLHQV